VHFGRPRAKTEPTSPAEGGRFNSELPNTQRHRTWLTVSTYLCPSKVQTAYLAYCLHLPLGGRFSLGAGRLTLGSVAPEEHPPPIQAVSFNLRSVCSCPRLAVDFMFASSNSNLRSDWMFCTMFSCNLCQNLVAEEFGDAVFRSATGHRIVAAWRLAL
jgi:hypothetical protein